MESIYVMLIMDGTMREMLPEQEEIVKRLRIFEKE